MHELSLADALMDQVLEQAQANQLQKITVIEIETGELRQVIPELMQEAFTSVSKESIAEGSELKIREVKAQARCRECQKTFSPQLDDFQCPQCQKANVEILAGDSIVLRSIEGEK